MALRYVLDENLRGPLWAALERSNLRRALALEIRCVGEDPDLPLAVDDPAILRWAEERGFVVVSSDVRTLLAACSSANDRNAQKAAVWWSRFKRSKAAFSEDEVSSGEVRTVCS